MCIGVLVEEVCRWTRVVEIGEFEVKLGFRYFRKVY